MTDPDPRSALTNHPYSLARHLGYGDNPWTATPPAPTPPAGGLGAPRTAAGRALLEYLDVAARETYFPFDGIRPGILAIEAEAARPASSALVEAAREMLGAVLALTGSVTGRDRLDAATTRLRAALAARDALAAQPPAPASVVEWTVVPGEDDDCGMCGRAKLHRVEPEYEPGGRYCDECGWDSRDTHPQGDHEHIAGVCGMSCGNQPAAHLASGDREPVVDPGTSVYQGHSDPRYPGYRDSGDREP